MATAPLLKVDVFSQLWPLMQLYAFSLIAMLQATLNRVWEDKLAVLLGSPNWPSHYWFTNPYRLLAEPPWEIPLQHDLLT